jgi:hypothetical protein
MWLIIVGVLFVAGILYYIIAGSMPLIVLGITIVCGAVLLFYIIRFIREKLRDNAYYRHTVEHTSSEELDRILKEPPPWKDYTYTPMYPEPKLDRTETVTCLEKEGEFHAAVVEFYEDGTRKVRCRGDCSDCPYRDVE